MPIFSGKEEKYLVCELDTKECVEYLREDSAINYAIEEAKKAGRELYVSHQYADKINIIGIANSDGTFERAKEGE